MRSENPAPFLATVKITVERGGQQASFGAIQF
jgi:hypothetical protein